ncbi:hypothetical protein CDV31_012267 [Fusarium ambrosium]|uniref:Alpha/beta hydrolase fold-3 domain-containing protein n=1 Tax=Fusarium ambrosium TaxID=131363 RepID=A0A428TB67_9HYPO|nr:hypothetical protein CDV31_012267 [Fusarium ambrosium]
MPLQFDPEYLQALEPLIPLMSNRPKLVLQDIPSSRKSREASISLLLSKLPVQEDVTCTVHHAVAPDGHRVPVYGFTKKGSQSEPGPAVLFCHGGGMITGSAQLYSNPVARLVSETSIPFFSVDYRLAPEHNGLTLVQDCYSVLLWLNQHSTEHNIDPARIAVYGESAGGGLAAGVVLMARDKNLQPPLAKQVLIYPMLDDRNSAGNEAIEPFAAWKTEDNITAWTAVLGDKAGDPNADVSPYSAPARAYSLEGLPPTYLDVGGLDIFRDETVAYAMRLMAENITTELHVYSGLPHGFELIGKDISATARAHENRIKTLLKL